MYYRSGVIVYRALADATDAFVQEVTWVRHAALVREVDVREEAMYERWNECKAMELQEDTTRETLGRATTWVE